MRRAPDRTVGALAGWREVVVRISLPRKIKRRGLFCTLGCLAAMAFPAAASAHLEEFLMGPEALLGPEGAAVTVPVTMRCTESEFVFFGVEVVQKQGNKSLVRGDGHSGQDLVQCTGTDQTFQIQVFAEDRAFKQGSAAAIGHVFGSDFQGDVGPQEIRIVRK